MQHQNLSNSVTVPNTINLLNQILKSAELILKNITNGLKDPCANQDKLQQLLPDLIKELDSILAIDPNYPTYKFFPMGMKQLALKNANSLKSLEVFYMTEYKGEKPDLAKWKYCFQYFEYSDPEKTELDKQYQDYLEMQKPKNNKTINDNYSFFEGVVTWGLHDIRRFLILPKLSPDDLGTSDLSITYQVDYNGRIKIFFYNGLPVLFSVNTNIDSNDLKRINLNRKAERITSKLFKVRYSYDNEVCNTFLIIDNNFKVMAAHVRKLTKLNSSFTKIEYGDVLINPAVINTASDDFIFFGSEYKLVDILDKDSDFFVVTKETFLSNQKKSYRCGLANSEGDLILQCNYKQIQYIKKDRILITHLDWSMSLIDSSSRVYYRIPKSNAKEGINIVDDWVYETKGIDGVRIDTRKINKLNRIKDKKVVEEVDITSAFVRMSNN